MKIQKTSPGFAHVGLVVVAVVALLGVLGYVGYNALTKKGNVAQTSSQKADAAGAGTCGSGYSELHSKVPTSKSGASGPAVLKVYVNYSLAKSNSKRLCGLMIHTGVSVGIKTPTSIVLNSSGDPATEQGNYSYYAGPVYTKAFCVSGVISGSLASGSIYYNGTNYIAAVNQKC